MLNNQMIESNSSNTEYDTFILEIVICFFFLTNCQSYIPYSLQLAEDVSTYET